MVHLTGVETVRRTIPHRYPVQLVDRVEEIVPGERIVTRKAVAANEPWCAAVGDDAGPHGYDLPVALLIESWCQSAALLSAWGQDDATRDGQVALFAGMSDVEITGCVTPGDVVVHEVVVSKAVAGSWLFEGTSTVDGHVVMHVDNVMTVLRPAAALDARAPS